MDQKKDSTLLNMFLIMGVGCILALMAGVFFGMVAIGYQFIVKLFGA